MFPFSFHEVLKCIHNIVSCINKTAVLLGWKYSNVTTELSISQRNQSTFGRWWVWAAWHSTQETRLYVPGKQERGRNIKKKSFTSKVNLWKYSLIFAVSIFSANWVHTYQNDQGLKIIDTSEHPLNMFWGMLEHTQIDPQKEKWNILVWHSFIWTTVG